MLDFIQRFLKQKQDEKKIKEIMANLKKKAEA
jgi:hypothetical protein